MRNIIPATKKASFAFAVILLSLVLPACAGTVPEITPANEEEQFLLQTIEALRTEASVTETAVPTGTAVPPTAIPASPVPATATSLPDPAFRLPEAERIQFASGATSTNVRGTIGPGQTRNFVLQAEQGQPLIAFVDSIDNDVKMSVTAESGTALLPAAQGGTSWQGTLPGRQDYFIQLTGGAREQDYSLSLSLPNRIQFEPGETSATLSGETVGGYNVSYVVSARGGQTMDILLTPESGVAALTVWGFSDGQPYMRAQMGSTTFSMELPSTQDYIIDVVPQAGQEVDFTLRVEIQS